MDDRVHGVLAGHVTRLDDVDGAVDGLRCALGDIRHGMEADDLLWMVDAGHQLEGQDVPLQMVGMDDTRHQMEVELVELDSLSWSQLHQPVAVVVLGIPKFPPK